MKTKKVYTQKEFIKAVKNSKKGTHIVYDEYDEANLLRDKENISKSELTLRVLDWCKRHPPTKHKCKNCNKIFYSPQDVLYIPSSFILCKECNLIQLEFEKIMKIKPDWNSLVMYENEIFILAKELHNKYEESSRKHNWKTQQPCQVLFEELPSENRAVMYDIAKFILKKYDS